VTLTAHRSHGFTLLELLVALVVMAMLGIMSWQAIDSALSTRDHVREVELRWQKLTRGVALIEANLMQVAERASANPNAIPDFKLEKFSDGEQRLIFWRTDATLGSRLAGFKHVKNQLLLLRWSHNAPVGEPVLEPVLEGVQNIQWTVLDTKQVWSPVWPAPGTVNPSGVPAGIRIEMDIEHVGHIQRTFALR